MNWITRLINCLFNGCPDPVPSPGPGPTPVPAVAAVTVAIINKSSSLDATQLQQMVTDLQAQVDEDFGPAWATSARLELNGKTGWALYLEDDATIPGALGFHELVNDLPVGHVFVRTAQHYGVDYRTVVSHELLEMLADPRTNMAVVTGSPDGTSGRLYMAEVCDAVEQSSYIKGSTPVSNFVTPAWFDTQATNAFDHLGQISAPLELLPGGSYIGILDFTSSQGWQASTARQ